MSETDILETMMLRASAGDVHCGEAAAEIQRLRRIVGERDSTQKRAKKFDGLWKAINPKMRVKTRGLPLHEKVVARTVVDEVTGCWVWQGGCCFNGYARLRRGYEGKSTLCHRIIYEHHNGPVQKGHVVMHTCDNRRCVNPDHLRSGTYKDNMLDMVQKGRSSSSILTEKDVREIHRLSENGHTVHSIAASFCVSRSTVSCILSGSRWSWIKAQMT